MVNAYARLTGGADVHCFGLAEALAKRGHEVRFLATYDERNVVHEGVFVTPSVTHDSRELLSTAAQAEVFVKALWNQRAAEGMRRLIREFRPDVVHAHKLYPQLSVAPVVVAAKAGVPVVQTLHDFEMISASALDVRGGWWDRDESRLRFQALNSATFPIRRRVYVPRVDAFVAVSRFVARVHARHGIDSAVLPNFVSYSESARGKLPAFDERHGILFVGRLRPEKGARDVVALARRVSDIPVTVIGSGVLKHELEREAADISNLEIAGLIAAAELPRLLRAARVVVVPSRWQEPGALVALEAMASGTPVVAYAVGGLAEYVTAAGGGRIVPIDVEALVSSAVELHTDRALWEALSQRAVSAVAQHHAPGVYAERMERLYEDVVRTSRNRVRT